MSANALDVLPQLLSQDQSSQLALAASGLNSNQLHWASGYLAGLAVANHNVAPALPLQESQPQPVLTILYGSQTGNGRSVAEKLHAHAESQGLSAHLCDMREFRPAALKQESRVVFVVSTHGEGEPPDDAEALHEYLAGKRAPNLNHLQYAVFALGDSSYEQFCKTGKDFDERLSALGAKVIQARVDCDLDYADAAETWSQTVVADVLANTEPSELRTAPHLHAVASTPIYSKDNPFPAELLVNQKITGRDSSKDIRHVEFSLEGSGLNYQPGDSLGVVVRNPPALVDEIVAQLNPESVDSTLAEVLARDVEITVLNRGFLEAYAHLANSAELDALLLPENKLGLLGFMAERQIIDILKQFPARLNADQFVPLLRKLTPRLYSIASSLDARPDEVHLTVAAVRYEAFGSEHFGAASTHLADRADVGDQLSVFIEPNNRFRLPADQTAPVIMIGPGTGIAPFRAFLQQREHESASGRNWLITGNPHFSSDFLYQIEWQRYLKQGLLNKLDLAFSRDQSNKIYVQQRIRENGAELFQWLNGGAYFYVCGDSKHMAVDVHRALLDVLAEHGGMSAEGADETLKELKRAGRYQRDVY